MRYKLGEIFNLQMGKTPDRHSPKFWNEGTEPWISIADLTKCNKYIENTAEKITATAVDESGIKIIPKNTVIMSFKLSIGKVAITPKEMYSNEAIRCVEPISSKVSTYDPTFDPYKKFGDIVYRIFSERGNPALDRQFNIFTTNYDPIIE